MSGPIRIWRPYIDVREARVFTQTTNLESSLLVKIKANLVNAVGGDAINDDVRCAPLRML
jgi:hypothetical protein